MQRMIRQFAAEYTSKNSSTQDSSQPNSTKNQSLLKASLVASSPTAATAQNPIVLKKGKGDGHALDSEDKCAVPSGSCKKQSAKIDCILADKRSSCGHENHNVVSSLKISAQRPGRPSQHHPEGLQSGDGVPPRSLQDGTREGYGHSTSLKVPLARSLQISEELLSRNQFSTAASHGPSGLQNHGQHLILSREASWAKPHYEFNFSRMKFRGNGALSNISDLPFLTENSAF
ncbi:LCOR protein, partial [Oxylabes madagascariensis]|nr:LCOR protein [Oxylabes madagascariensis]